MLVIGIAGGSGSGKSTVVREIIKRVPSTEQVVVIPQDSYYKDQSHLSMDERQALNFDHPDSIDFDLLNRQLAELKSGKAVEQPQYSYLTCSRLAETVRVEPADIVIIEGILVFCNKKLRDQMDIKIYVDADDDDRLMRIIERDIAQRGKTVPWVIDRYNKTVKPMHLEFIAPSKRYADIIVPQGGHNIVAIKVLWEGIRRFVGQEQCG
ncbi:MAG: uridine kinase [Bacteroidales bacterium]|nr:uridine kinase [Candidatus Cacconaster scatequi]